MSALLLRPILLPPTFAGHPAPCDLFDERGTLLARAGTPLGQARDTTAIARRFYCRAGQAPSTTQPEPLRTLRDIGEALAMLDTLVTDGTPPPASAFLELAAHCHAAWRFDPDACIGYARLAQLVSPAVDHLLLATLFAAEIGHAHGLGQSATTHLIGAALTMNLGSLALHDHMHGLREPPDDERRAALLAHPWRAAELLAGCGSLPEDWLRAVAEHHENIDGSGYPLGLRRGDISLGARILRVADVFAARLRGRINRPPRYWNIGKAAHPEQLIRHVFSEDLERLDPHLVRLLAHRLGSFPPGSTVRLSNGELAVIHRRPGGNGTPRHALSLCDARGRPHRAPRQRPLNTHECRIQRYAHDDPLLPPPDYDWSLLWGYGEEPEAPLH
ncbi:HD domain-containing protein [Pseudothauera nasutitermitis]|uniref:HD domain-containing protein n=1 Tax=Pseudothauera nasutitermitis TaxID=2565930 RepID=A0A4S4AZW6_9RHOO|nr:HD domain-containing phosphohydrolase [Pseudothauera nasutitermitis]THF65743.1 HD domain-containing protein [Pseudothauera nasutitermitis]